MPDRVKLTEDQKPAALAALYNRARPQGAGFIHFTPQPMSVDEASGLLEDDFYFDYLKGRVIKCDFRGDELWLHLYDRDNGHNAGYDALVAAGVVAGETAERDAS